MHIENDYTPPTSLTVLSAIFLILGAICFLVISADIIWRRGWRSMMWIMIPVYPINAAYMLPVTLYTYFKYGRAAKPTLESDKVKPACHTSQNAAIDTMRNNDLTNAPESEPMEQSHHCNTQGEEPKAEQSPLDAEETQHGQYHSHQTSVSDAEKGQSQSGPMDGSMAHCHHHNDDSRPMWATVLVGVSHCGAGCVLGDLVGEWLVYGTGATINGQSIWVELLVDYAFALLFGIAFQYFSIAPMSGEYGPKTIWRAAKADVLSLTSFEVGAFGWMIIYQVGIFDYKLSMLTWTYWWMMQIGMAFGFVTAMPVNWYLISKGIKEPCA